MNAREYAKNFVEAYHTVMLETKARDLEGVEKLNYVTEKVRELVGEAINGMSVEMQEQYKKHETKTYFITCYREARQKWAAFAARVNKELGFDYIKPNGFQAFWEMTMPEMAIFADNYLIVPDAGGAVDAVELSQRIVERKLREL